jgi:hypothetical protein
MSMKIIHGSYGKILLFSFKASWGILNTLNRVQYSFFCNENSYIYKLYLFTN